MINYDLKILALSGLVFLVYFLVSWKSKKLGIGNLESALSVENGLEQINIKHSIGIVSFGMIFLIFSPEFDVHLTGIREFNLVEIIVVVLLISLAIIISIRSARSTEIHKAKIDIPTIQRIRYYFIVRTIFLFSYELFFRGILFFLLIDFVGVIWAILIVTGSYILIHIFDSKVEIIGSLPFGIILCLISYFTHSIWGPFAIHLGLSMAFELTRFSLINQKIVKS
ncbi:MAG: CPBP family intramembrane metalloprotease [Flavobacteriaceae bacterium]|nr:CPBP family intramembrane metalloprotease [Flavobacteriaceae bacterium]